LKGSTDLKTCSNEKKTCWKNSSRARQSLLSI